MKPRNRRQVELNPLGVGAVNELEHIRHKEGWSWSELIREALKAMVLWYKGAKGA